MKLTLHCALVLFYIGFSVAATAREYQTRIPGKPPFCVDKIEGKKKVGEEWQNPKECLRMICDADSDGIPYITYQSCGSLIIPKNCKLITPTEPKRYPDCCPQPQCPDDTVE